MIDSIAFYVFVIFIVVVAINLTIAIKYEDYLKQFQYKFTPLQLAKEFASDHPVIGAIYLYTVYLMLGSIPTLFLLWILKLI